MVGEAHEATRARQSRTPDALLRQSPPLQGEVHFVIFGGRHLRHLLREFVAHYHGERFHQALDGQLIGPPAASSNDNGSGSSVECRSRLGGLLNFYHREAA